MKFPLSVTTGPAIGLDLEYFAGYRAGDQEKPTLLNSHSQGCLWRAKNVVKILQYLRVRKWNNFDWHALREL